MESFPRLEMVDSIDSNEILLNDANWIYPAGPEIIFVGAIGFIEHCLLRNYSEI